MMMPQPNVQECPAECFLAVNKLLDIDSAFIQFAYQEHYRRNLNEAAAERMLQNERLASIGQMVTGLAHESRNALQRSGACLEALLLEVEDRPEAQLQANRIQSALDHLNVLYEEVRNYAAPIRLDLENVRLDRAIERVWQNLKPLWQSHRTQFHIEQPGHFRATVQADGHRLEQILTNLLQNSIQAASDDGQINCIMECIADRKLWALHIDDNGPGIPDEIVSKIFDPFFTTKPKGTGLGLAITRRIVQAHGGDITAEQSPLGGARFTLLLPALHNEDLDET
jgi:signal transduction histidine kinase